MPLDPLSPIGPARVRALVVPIGRIKRERFNTFVDRLNSEHVVYLRDISADGRPNRNMFSPLAFPAGAMFFELMTHVPSASHLALSPFDLYREPLALIAIADGEELRTSAFDTRASSGLSLEEANIRTLYKQLENLRDDHAKILVHRVLIFEHVPSPKTALPEGIDAVPPLSQHKRTTMKTVMCDISALILAEMTTLARSFESMSYIESPGQGTRNSNWSLSGQGEGTDRSFARNSMASSQAISRSASTSGVPDRSFARMSVPSMPSKSGSIGPGAATATGARPTTPVNSGKSALANPLTTFAEKPSSAPASPEQNNSPSRPGTAEGFRTPMQGFGSGGLSERWRNKGKSRVQIIIGSMYMQAGRWTDAVRELVDGATVSKAINDHLWHGKALELVLVCLVLLSWADIEFQVPTIMLPQADRAHANMAATQDLDLKVTDQARWVRHLQVLLPELAERILALYSRISAEHLPPHPLAEATIRLCKLLSAIHVCDGRLDRASLDIVVVGAACPKLSSAPRFNIVPTRTQIASTLNKAFPTSEQGQWVTVDRIAILGGIASVLGSLGFQRKKAMVVKGIVSVLIGGLVEARTRGAADVGIHPAAGLLAPNGMNGHSRGSVALELGGDVEQGLDVFLAFVLKTYGVATFDGETGPEDGASTASPESAAIARIRKQSASRFFGFRDIKVNMLRTCINFSEALPDFAGVMRFSSDLLRTAGSGVAPGSRREHLSPAITREEQVRLVANITKTFNLALRMGLSGSAAEYWDEFLLRGVRLEAAPSSRTPIAHAKSILPDAAKSTASEGVNPFIYNPFLKQPDKATVDKMLVAGEMATFSITLQNPYETDVDIEKVQLDTEGVEFDSSIASTVVGPYRTQTLKLLGTAKSAGSLKVKGAIIQVRGCRSRSFPIFVDAWAPEQPEKIKSMGLASLDRDIDRHSPISRPLTCHQVNLDVISCQPVVVVKSTTLPQSSVMMLEGERQTFSVTLENLSTTAADFLLFSFQDSTQEPLQTALGRRDATAAELYEYEVMLARQQALRCKKGDGQPRFIGPGQTATFDFEMLGKPGLTNGLIQIDYAYLGVPHDEVGETFYTRQVSLDLTITVNASVEVARMDILPLHGTVPALLRPPFLEAKDAATDDQLCLVVLDLRNAWPGQMLVELNVTDGTRIEGQILPGNTSRVLVPLRRVYLADPHAFIPTLDPSRQRQFVVSTQMSPDVERANREAFWYREAVLDALRGTWRTTCAGGGRSGTLELRNMRLTSRMVEAVKVDDVEIAISMEPAATASSTGRSSPVIFTDEFVQLRVRVTNRMAAVLHATLRLMPALRHRPVNVALDFTRKLAWNGTLQQLLPAVEGGATVETVVGLTPLCRGQFEITGSVEETRLAGEEKEGHGKGNGNDNDNGRRRADTQSLMDAALGRRERRIWHSRRPCVVVVRDRA